jgi:putative membrane protein
VYWKGKTLMMFWGYGYGWPMVGMVFWNLLWLGFLALLIWLLVHWLARAITSHPHDRAPQPSALEILCQRYARGEIDTTTFEQMRERLEASRERQPVSSR